MGWSIGEQLNVSVVQQEEWELLSEIDPVDKCKYSHNDNIELEMGVLEELNLNLIS